MMFDKRNYALSSWMNVVKVLSSWRRVATIGSIALILTACEEYSQRFEDKYEFGLSADRAPAFDGNSMTDYRDNFSYSVRKVGNLWWMMDDLAHPFFTDEAYKETYCYKDKEGVCDEIGRLYPGEYLDYACPKGWRFPSLEEWTEFFNSKVFREYTPRHNGASDLYKGYVDGEHVLNGYGEDAYYWTNSHYFSDSYIDCVHYKRNTSSSGGIEPDYSSLSTAELCHEQWKLAVRCVKNADSELTTSSSSGSIVPSSSQTVVVGDRVPCGDMWCGLDDTEGWVNTGSSDDAAGYWYDFNDAIRGGNSIVNFPTDVEENTYGNFFGPLVEMYMGIKGNFVLGDSYDYPYVGLAFDVVKRCKENMFKTQKYKSSCVPQYDSFGNQSNRCPDSLSRQVGYDVLDCEKGGDISEWGGLCLVYESSSDFDIELAPEQESKVTEYANYKAAVSNTGCCGGTPAMVDIPWAEFKQGVWGKKADQATVLSKIAAIRLSFEGSAGTSGEFYIRSIGRLGTCK